MLRSLLYLSFLVLATCLLVNAAPPTVQRGSYLARRSFDQSPRHTFDSNPRREELPFAPSPVADTNAKRLAQGLPPLKPKRRGTPTRRVVSQGVTLTVTGKILVVRDDGVSLGFLSTWLRSGFFDDTAQSATSGHQDLLVSATFEDGVGSHSVQILNGESSEPMLGISAYDTVNGAITPSTGLGGLLQTGETPVGSPPLLGVPQSQHIFDAYAASGVWHVASTTYDSDLVFELSINWVNPAGTPGSNPFIYYVSSIFQFGVTYNPAKYYPGANRSIVRFYLVPS